MGPRGTAYVSLGPVPSGASSKDVLRPLSPAPSHTRSVFSYTHIHLSEVKATRGDWLASRSCRQTPCHFYGKEKALFLLPPTLAHFILHGGLDAITAVSYGPFMFTGADNSSIS